MKKILAVLLAVLTVFSCTAMFAAAEDVSEPEVPEETVARYDICQDPDFMNVVFMEKGNDKATILRPGDIITTYKTNDLTFEYYADADGMYKGDWTPADTNNLAFSVSGQELYKELFRARVTKEGVVRDIDYTDFTIAYSDENRFVGWVIYDFMASSNTVKLVGVWEKNHKIPVADDTDDFYYILNFFYSLRAKIAAPFLKAIKTICNAVLFVKVWLYNLIFGEKTAA